MNAIFEVLERVRKQKPLVHHITNWVTIYDCANITRSFGALPVMAHAKEEAADMASIANVLVLNIGTLTEPLVESMILAGKKANEKGIAVVLDAVGAGATPFRSAKCKELLENLKVDIVKGNHGEIASLAGIKAEVKGVESISAAMPAKELAKKFANDNSCVAVITGKEDFISNGKKNYCIKNGSAMMSSLVGTGCMAASVIGSFAAVERDYAKAAAYALCCYGIAGELAAAKSKGPGSFKENFYDEVSLLDEGKIKKMAKVEEYA